MYEKIRDILLQHKGKANAITAKKISNKMGFSMEDTQSVCRRAIRETVKIYEIPLVSCNKGFFIANTDEEIEEYNSNIQSRIDEMKKTRNMANKNYKKGKNELHS